MFLLGCRRLIGLGAGGCGRYVSLDRRAQHTIATQIGSDRKVILNNLREFMANSGFS